MLLVLAVALVGAARVATLPAPPSPLHHELVHHGGLEPQDREAILVYLESLRKTKPSCMLYPPVLPASPGMPGHAQDVCGPISSAIEGKWVTLQTRHLSTNETQLSSLFIPKHGDCRLAEERPTVHDAAFLLNRTVVFMGDSHLRYMSNYFGDFLEGSCKPSIYLHDATLDKDLCYGFHALCSAERPEGWQNTNFSVVPSAAGGLFPGEGASVPGLSPVTEKVNIHFKWAPWEMPFQTRLKSTPECMKELSNAWVKNYTAPQLRSDCAIASDILDEAVRFERPLAVVMGLSQIHWTLDPKAAFRLFTRPEYAQHKNRIILYNHRAAFSEMFRDLERREGFRVIDIAPSLSEHRFCNNTHLGGSAGTIAARALFWKLKALVDEEVRDE
jgi:hypothetical protein